jgi:hypothetical protein
MSTSPLPKAVTPTFASKESLTVRCVSPFLLLNGLKTLSLYLPVYALSFLNCEVSKLDI